jgi:acylphosphatase
MPAKRVIYSGHVQNVGFRYAVKQIASGYEVVGTVQNLEDGRVELQASSWSAEELEGFIEAIKDSSLGGNIKEVKISPMPELTGVRGFSIVR